MFILGALCMLQFTAVAMDPSGTIALSTVSAMNMAFDVYEISASLRIRTPEGAIELETSSASLVTDHKSRNMNAKYADNNGTRIAFVSERDGQWNMFLKDIKQNTLERLTSGVPMDDHAAFSPKDGSMVFVSTAENPWIPKMSWNAIYTTMDGNGYERHRLTPKGQSDFSPSFSWDGEWIAFASYLEETCSHFTLGIMRPDGTERMLFESLVGGWPTWAVDNSGLYFHRLGHDGQWGVYYVRIFKNEEILSRREMAQSVKKINPNHTFAMTPTALAGVSDFLVVSMFDTQDSFRQIGLLQISTGNLSPLTTESTPHFNPSATITKIQASGDGFDIKLVFHACRAGMEPYNADWFVPNVEAIETHFPNSLSVIRTIGSYPSFSPEGDKIAMTTDFSHVDVMDLNGGNKRRVISDTSCFYVSWIPNQTHSQLLVSHGNVFQPADSPVDIMMINASQGETEILTRYYNGNHAFPSPSPDGKRFVFRSGMDGHKNLFIMEMGLGEKPEAMIRLTKGNWTDTMPNWSPDGKWIAFSRSTNGHFSLWLIRPDGTDEHEILHDHGRINHPWFSPDSKWLVFASDYAGCSSEAISVPFMYQPYGEIFILNLEDPSSGPIRLTHNGFEDGTPSWTSAFLSKDEIVANGSEAISCAFMDVIPLPFETLHLTNLNDIRGKLRSNSRCPFVHGTADSSKISCPASYNSEGKKAENNDGYISQRGSSSQLLPIWWIYVFGTLLMTVIGGQFIAARVRRMKYQALGGEQDQK